MKVTVEIPDDDARILQEWSEIEFPILVQGWVKGMVEYMKEMKLATDAGVGLTVDEVQKIMREKIGNTLSNAKKLSALKKVRLDNE